MLASGVLSSNGEFVMVEQLDSLRP
jgi:hypothetical protein